MKPLAFISTHWAAFTLFMLVAITALSFWPLPSLPPVPGNDKTLHLVAYAALMFPVALRRPGYWTWLGLCFIAYSGIIELLQPYVNRYGQWSDLAANAIGIVCGLLLATGLQRVFRAEKVGAAN